VSIPKSINCPECNRRLPPSGTVTHGETIEAVYQCDQCTEVVEMFGEPFEVALTISIPIDDKTPDQDLN
jgi:hypothetical protein